MKSLKTHYIQSMAVLTLTKEIV